MDIFDKTILAFERRTPVGEPAVVRMVYVKQNSETLEYAIKFMRENGEKVLYTTTMWLPVALNTVALLMAEHGIGCPWNLVQA